MNRIADLLNKAADALDDGQNPLCNPFLRDHEVTYTECMDLGDNLALGARLVAWVHENPQQAATLFRSGLDGVRMEIITKILRRMARAGDAR